MADDKAVETVEDIDLAKANSAFNLPEGSEMAGDLPCYYNGKVYGEGSLICTPAHQAFVCSHFGRWIPNGRC